MGVGRVKRVLKGSAPANLQTFRQARPQAGWEALRSDPHHGGQTAYDDIRKQTHQDQGGLCAYCEIDIRDNDPLKSLIEHFHPKSDRSGDVNWALDWSNMLAVCKGGSYKHVPAPHSMEPLSENQSCDVHKNHRIQQGKLPENCNGWVLNPLHLPAWPSLFEIDKFSGELRASEAHCAAAAPWPNNQHSDVASLVQHTIASLNLNCPRLCKARLAVVRDIEHNKKKQRLAGVSPQQGLANLAQRYLLRRWRPFFTTICLCLGSGADEYLQKIQYQG